MKDNSCKLSKISLSFVVSSIAIIFGYLASFAQSEYVGGSVWLDNPSVYGVIDATAWYCDNGKGDYLTITESSSGASVRIDQYFDGDAKICCQYAYRTYGGSKEHGREYYYVSANKSRTTLDKTEMTMAPGEVLELTYTNSSGNKLFYQSWKTTDRKVADFNGSELELGKGERTVKVYAQSAGECEIICYANTGYENPKCKIKVVAVEPKSIEFTKKELTLMEGKTGSFSINYNPVNASSKITWTSSDESVAKVSASGLISGLTAGSAIITATTANGLSASGKVIVVSKPSAISLPVHEDVYLGYSKILELKITPAGSEGSFKWSTSDNKVATVDNTGKVKAISEGTATIYVSGEGLNAECRVTVKKPTDEISILNVKNRMRIFKKMTKNISNTF